MKKSFEMYSEMIHELEEKLNYAFDKKDLLLRALTHSSFSNEMKINKADDNERLEFLGDAVLELSSSEFLFSENQQMKEGDLSKLRASLVCEQSLAACARELSLGNYLFLGKGEDVTGGRERNSILSDALEAVIGAIYLDGGYEEANRFILDNVLADISNRKLFYDSKTRLQEYVQSIFKKKLSYRLIYEEGPDHDKRFCVQVQMEDMMLSRGVGKTKKAAAQEAAYLSLKQLKAMENSSSGG